MGAEYQIPPNTKIMKECDLRCIRNGMAMGSGSEAFETDDGRAYNISGAASVLQNVYEQVQNYSLTFPDDFPDTRDDSNPDSADVTDSVNLVSVQEVREAQQALQYFEDKFGSLLASFTGNDASIEDDNGNSVVNLPEQASSAAKSADLPDVASV